MRRTVEVAPRMTVLEPGLTVEPLRAVEVRALVLLVEVAALAAEHVQERRAALPACAEDAVSHVGDPLSRVRIARGGRLTYGRPVRSPRSVVVHHLHQHAHNLHSPNSSCQVHSE